MLLLLGSRCFFLHWRSIITITSESIIKSASQISSFIRDFNCCFLYGFNFMCLFNLLNWLGRFLLDNCGWEFSSLDDRGAFFIKLGISQE